MRGDLQGRLAGPRHGAGEHLVEHDAHGVDVGARVGLGGRGDLGRDVRHGPEHVAGRGHRDLGGRSGQAEVGDLGGAVGGNEDVLGFDVAVDDADAVGGTQSLERVGRVAQRLGDREGALRAQELAQVRAVDEFHDEESLARHDPLVEDRDDAGVHDARGRACLASETLDECGRVCQVRVHHFEGDGPVESLILGDVHGSHAAAGQPAGDPVSFVDQ